MLLLLVTACSNHDSLLQMSAPERQTALKKLPPIEQAHAIYTLDVDEYRFVEVNGWFDDEEILYLTDENGRSNLYRHHLFSGEQTLFYSTEEPILDVVPSTNNKYFALKISPIYSEANLLILDQNGDVLMEWIDDGVGFELFWNPYEESDFLIGAIDQEYSSTVHHLNVESDSRQEYDLLPSYLQWLSADRIAYLYWEDYSFGIDAPVYVQHLDDDVEVADVLEQEVLTFFGLAEGKYITLREKSSDPDYTEYKINDIDRSGHEFSWDVPVLQTYSQDWWVPYFDHQEDQFVYFHPQSPGDVYDYDDYFMLRSVNVDSGEQTELEEFERQKPVQLSPGGDWILVGDRMEMLIHAKRGSRIPLM
ncbi:hypothetical protein [Alteribacter populi]|uniref:YqgU-like beta propeller domain-containing protein n=1 Tax=Alteribacter populi TaxID=2011011 RepID=UPI0012FF6FAC|nr:hypothetical protein [Alteribacter populi]